MTRSRKLFCGCLVVAWCAVARRAMAAQAPAPADPARVRAACLQVYLHGMTAEIAEREVGRSGVSELLRLLDEPSFPRRDNVVAFLAYLGASESTPALMRALARPLPSAAVPEDQRAVLLIPHALGWMSARGDDGALQALLSLTGNDAAASGPAARPGVLDTAIASLALVGRLAARERLAAIASGGITPDPHRPELAQRALRALETPPAPAAGGESPAASDVASVPDPASETDAHGLTFLNHVSVSAPMTAARLDSVLKEGSFRAAKGDFDGDVPCCTIVLRSGTGGTFGASQDGLDVIDDVNELNAVLQQGGGRVKVVNAINFCGTTGTNIIGCSYSPGNGMAVVRLSSLSYEAVLWVHEYGHNIGRPHATDHRMIMYGTDDGTNDGLQSADCAAFHAPPASASALMSRAGTCTNDGDSYADPIDNCPLVANEDQTDSNGNGVGDACETGPLIEDIDHSGRVDGLDLAILSRAFGAAAGDAGYVAAADLDHDGRIDGADLALLASQFGK